MEQTKVRLWDHDRMGDGSTLVVSADGCLASAWANLVSIRGHTTRGGCYRRNRRGSGTSQRQHHVRRQRRSNSWTWKRLPRLQSPSRHLVPAHQSPSSVVTAREMITISLSDEKFYSQISPMNIDREEDYHLLAEDEQIIISLPLSDDETSYQPQPTPIPTQPTPSPPLTGSVTKPGKFRAMQAADYDLLPPGAGKSIKQPRWKNQTKEQLQVKGRADEIKKIAEEVDVELAHLP